MARSSSRQNQAVRDFILRNVRAHPATVSARTAREFGLSRVTVSNYIRRLIAEGLLAARGNTSARRYRPVPLAEIRFRVPLSAGLSEDAVWRFRVLSQLRDLPENVRDLCQYGFTEIFNNAVDHSASPTADVFIEQTYGHLQMTISDGGVGIFKKIQHDYNLDDPRQALLELSKGRLTSDRARHTGQGIFFTSRMFDEFTILSGELFYRRVRQTDDDWLIESQDRSRSLAGTSVIMALSTNAAWTTRQVFEKSQGDVVGFSKTHVPLTLGKYPGEQLVSRSQARRILARVDRFSEALLDFYGVEEIGPAFADEIFRVFKNAHPEVKILAMRAKPAIQRIINSALAPADDDQPSLFR